MSMIVTTVVQGGIVMAADSATTKFQFADMKNIFLGNYELAVKNKQMGAVPSTDENVLNWSTSIYFNFRAFMVSGQVLFNKRVLVD